MAIDILQSTADPVATDIGNRDVQGRLVSKTIQFGMFTANQNAVWAGRKELQKQSFPFMMVDIKVNRHLFNLRVGDCFKAYYTPYGITGMVCRILQIEEESLESEAIVLHCMEDMYSKIYAFSEFSKIRDLRPPGVDYTAYPFDHQSVREAPYVLSQNISILPAACRKGDQDLGFDVYMSIDGGASYLFLNRVSNIVPYGTLVGSYPEDTNPIDEDVGFIVEFVKDADDIESVTWSEVFSGQKNIALLGTEIISFHSITPLTGQQYKLEGVIRGRYGTVRVLHTEGTEFYFFLSSMLTIVNSELIANVVRKFKFVPFNARKSGDILESTELSLLVHGWALAPYTPSNFMANGSQFAARYDTDIILTWDPRYRGKGAGIGMPGIALADDDYEGLFEVEVWAGFSKKRTQSAIDAVTWTYTQAMNIADNGSLASEVGFNLSNYRLEGGIIYKSPLVWVYCEKNA